MQLPWLGIHPGADRAGCYGRAGVMDDLVAFAHDLRYLDCAQPADIAGLAAALRMKRRGRQVDRVATIFQGSAAQHFGIGFQRRLGQVEAVGYGWPFGRSGRGMGIVSPG